MIGFLVTVWALGVVAIEVSDLICPGRVDRVLERLLSGRDRAEAHEGPRYGEDNW